MCILVPPSDGCEGHTDLEVLLKHRQFELLDAFRIVGVQHDPLAHQVPSKNANAVLALSTNGLPALEKLLSQLVDLKEGKTQEKKKKKNVKKDYESGNKEKPV